MFTNAPIAFAAENPIVPDLESIYEEYKDDEQYKLMRSEYGEEYAETFLKEVLKSRIESGIVPVDGSANAAKIATLDNEFNADKQGHLVVYQARDALNKYYHARTQYINYYGGHASGHYLSLDYINKSTDIVRIVDCNNNDAYYGIHNVT